MNITISFANALKLSLVVVVVMSVYSFLLSYFGMYGISISHPHDNIELRIILNKVKSILAPISFWILIGYICKDYKAAVLALLVYIGLYFGFEKFYPKIYPNTFSPKDIKYYLFPISGILPVLTFGFIHFKNSKAIKLIIYWVIIWGLSISLNTYGFERMIDGLTRIFGMRGLFEFHIPIGESSHRSISILRVLNNELFLIVKMTVFWWIYQIVKSNQSLWDSMNTIYVTSANDRFSYSIIYWSFRIMLFIAGFGIVSFITNSFRSPLDIITFTRTIMGTIALIITASIYRNMLLSYFIYRNKYPGNEFFLLNIPIINFFMWLYSIVTYKTPYSEVSTTSQMQKNFIELKSRFVQIENT